MAGGKRLLAVAQAILHGAAASREQVVDFIWTGRLNCRSATDDPEPMPYDGAAVKALVASGRMG